MNNSAVKLIEEVQNGYFDSIDRLFNREFMYDFPETISDWPKNPLKVRKTERKIEVVCLARNSFWYFLTEIYRVNCKQDPKYMYVNKDILRAAWCMQYNISFATDRIPDHTAVLLRNAYAVWLSYQQHATIATATVNKTIADLVGSAQRRTTEMRPKWLDGVYIIKDAVANMDQDRAIVNNIFKGHSINVMFYIGEAIANQHIVFYGHRASRCAVRQHAVENDNRYFTALMGKSKRVCS